MSPFFRFLLLMLAIDAVGFVIAALVFPAGSSSQLWFVGGTLLASPIVAFYVVFDGDPDALWDAFTN